MIYLRTFITCVCVKCEHYIYDQMCVRIGCDCFSLLCAYGTDVPEQISILLTYHSKTRPETVYLIIYLAQKWLVEMDVTSILTNFTILGTSDILAYYRAFIPKFLFRENDCNWIWIWRDNLSNYVIWALYAMIDVDFHKKKSKMSSKKLKISLENVTLFQWSEWNVAVKKSLHSWCDVCMCVRVCLCSYEKMLSLQTTISHKTYNLCKIDRYIILIFLCISIYDSITSKEIVCR